MYDQLAAALSQDVLAAFREYVSGERDNQLAQAAITLLIGLGFTPEKAMPAYDGLVRARRSPSRLL
jgi:hypothetical protein